MVFLNNKRVDISCHDLILNQAVSQDHGKLLPYSNLRMIID